MDFFDVKVLKELVLGQKMEGCANGSYKRSLVDTGGRETFLKGVRWELKTD